MDSAQFRLHAEIEDRHWWFTGRRSILRRLCEAVLPSKGERPLVIDIGCGTGANLATFADRYECLGIDTSADAISAARAKYPRIPFVQGFAPDDILDQIRRARLVMLNDVLEHVRDDFLLLSRILAELQPGAMCLITVPADPSLWSPHDESFGHYRRYTPQRLQMLWQGLPLKQRFLSHFNTRLYPIIKTVRTLNNLRGTTRGAARTDFALPPGPVNNALESLFAGEWNVLSQALRGQRRGYEYGTSLVTVLERDTGNLQPWSKPLRAGPDIYDPELRRHYRRGEQSAEPQLVPQLSG